jgi:hypothetical protein
MPRNTQDQSTQDAKTQDAKTQDAKAEDAKVQEQQKAEAAKVASEAFKAEQSAREAAQQDAQRKAEATSKAPRVPNTAERDAGQGDPLVSPDGTAFAPEAEPGNSNIVPDQFKSQIWSTEPVRPQDYDPALPGADRRANKPTPEQVAKAGQPVGQPSQEVV